MGAPSSQHRQTEERHSKGFHTHVATSRATLAPVVRAPPSNHHGNKPRAHGDPNGQPEHGRELFHGCARNIKTVEFVPRGFLQLDIDEATGQSHCEEDGEEGGGEDGQEGGPQEVSTLHHVAAHRRGEVGEAGGEGGAGAQAALELGEGGGLVGLEHQVGLNGGFGHWK